MKYCTNCGAKLEKDAKFCTGCGGLIVEEGEVKQEVIKEKTEINTQKLILVLGVFLVLFASFIFGVFTWNSLSPEFRISFFAFETVLFFGLSFVLKKANTKLDRLFFIIGLIMVPYTLSLVPYYGLISSYISNGTGLFVYLAICYLLTGIIYLLVNTMFKSKAVTYLSITAFFLSFISFGLAVSTKIEYILLYIIILLTICHLASYYKSINENIRKVLYYFSIIAIHALILFIFLVFLRSYVEKFNFSVVVNGLSLALFVINLLINLGINKKSPFMYATPIIVGFLSYFYFLELFDDFNLILYFTSLVAVFIHYLSYLLNENTKMVSVCVTYAEILFSLFLSLVVSLFDNGTIMGPFVLSSILLLFNILTLLIHKFKAINYLIPINIVLTFLFLFRWLGNLRIFTLLIIMSGVFILLYAVFKIINKKVSYAYLITGAFTLLISTIFSGVNAYNLNRILILSLSTLLYVLTIIFKEKNYVKIPAFVFFNFAIVNLVAFKDIYYALLAISSCVILGGSIIGILNKDNNRGVIPYLLYGQILLLTISFFNSFNHPWYILLIHSVALLCGLFSLIKFINVKPYRITYLVIFLLFLVRFIDVIIEPTMISTIVCFATILIILITLYLANIEDSITISFLSLVLLFPYYNLLVELSVKMNELYLAPLVIYTILITSVVKFKEEYNRKLATIIPLSILAYLFILFAYRNNRGDISSIIFDIILGGMYIILGVVRKYNFFIILGVVLILATIFIRLWTIMNSVVIVFILIALGFVLIGIALYLDLHKKKD